MEYIPSEGRLLDSVNPTEHFYPSVGTGMEDGSRLYHDSGVVVREMQVHAMFQEEVKRIPQVVGVIKDFCLI